MAIELKVPPAGESITEVQIGEWLKKEGDSVRQDETIVVIETDKVTVELPSPADGVIKQIVIPDGEDANVGDVIGYLEEGSVAQTDATPGATEAPVVDVTPAVAISPAISSAAAPPTQPGPGSELPLSADVRDSLPPEAFARVMPAARRAAATEDVEISSVRPSGPGGRVLKEDVMRTAATPSAPAVISAPAVKVAPPRVRNADARGEEVVKMTPLRRKIAQTLVESQQTMALLTTFNEVDMSAVMSLRKKYQDGFVKKYGIKVGFMSFFLKAAIEALKEFPSVNAEVNGREVVYKNYYDIGIAVGGGKGLVVPVVRDADRLSFSEVEKTIFDFGTRAKKNSIKLEELQGGTFTISNGGVYGSMLSTPIVNPPQSGILGLHNIVERPVAINGKVEIRPIMYIALTYDHRIVDGREAVTFLRRIKECIEDPSRILLEA
jgi:2-oxoglutarate dehydrogenase E2 component (dihydrolipoamide succinyltransferase)